LLFVKIENIFISFYFVLFCSSNQRSQAVAIHAELDKAPTTAHELRTNDKIKTLRAIGY